MSSAKDNNNKKKRKAAAVEDLNAEELWAHLQATHKKESDAVKAEKENLEQEKKSMTKIKADPSDIITINVGGKVVIQAHRDTLCLAKGSAFSSMFTGRWEESCARDEQGRIFLDHNAEMIEWIVDHLRQKKIEDPAHPVPPPAIPEEKKEGFIRLLKYFGLEDFVFPVLPVLSCLQAVPASSPMIGLSSVGQGKHLVVHTSLSSGDAFVAFSPSLKGRQAFYWKCTIVTLPNKGWLFLGVIHNQNPSEHSQLDSTSFGWGGHNQQWSAGRANSSSSTHGWTGFVQGEALYFELKNQTLTMYSNVKKRLFSIPNVPKNPFIHLNLHHAGTVVELDQLSATEKSAAGW